VNGFLGTGATFKADVNLVAQLAMGVVLIAGTFLARAKRYTAHGICQTAVMFLNLAMILSIMWPSFDGQVLPALPNHLTDTYYGVGTAHGILGGVAELFGIYLALAAGTEVLPRSVRVQRWKIWMRVELGLWWAVILSGAVTYYVWYVQTP